MAARTIEARLVIAGEDRGASAAIAKVVQSVRQMEDAAKVSKPLQEVAKSLQQVEQAGRAVDGAFKARAGFTQVEAGLKAARDAAAATARALDDARKARAAFEGVKAAKGSEQAQAIAATTKAVNEAATAHRKAEGEVRKATAAVAAQSSALEHAEAVARRAGADLGNLEAHQRRLQQTYDATTAAIVRQVRAEEQAGRVGAVMGGAGRAQLDRIEAGRRLADGMSAQARAARSLADEEARLLRIEHERKRLSAGSDIAAGMGGVGRAEAVRIASGRRLADGMGQPAREAAALRAQAAEELSALRAVRIDAAKALASGAGIYIGHKASEAGHAVGHTYAEFDDLIRKQVVVADLSKDERKSRINQAIKLGGSSLFNDIQVLEAQTTLTQRGVKKQFIEPFVGEIVNYAQAMGTTLPEAAKTLEGVIFSTNQNVEDANSALSIMRKNVDTLVKTAKVGGLEDQDLKEAFKFGGASGTGAGLSVKTMGTIFATLHRVGYAGSEAGVATRAIAARLVSPTNKGRDALDAMGIDYNKFTTMPDAMSGKGLGSMVRRSLGKDMTPEQVARIQAQIDDQTFTDEEGKERRIVEDQGQFTAALAPILLEKFAKNKKGQYSVKDQKDVAKILGRFYSMSVESVDSEGLLSAILAKDPTMAQANAFFSEKHGGKIVAMARKLDVFKEIMAAIEHVPEGFGKNVGDARTSGFAGARKRVENTRLNMETAAGRALDNDGEGNGGILTKVLSTIADFQQHIAELDPKIVALGGGVAYAGAKLAEIAGTAGLMGSAYALIKSATALDAAAVRLGAGGVAGAAGAASTAGTAGAAGVAGNAVKAAPLAGFGLGGITLGLGAAAGFAGYATATELPKVVAEKGLGAVPLDGEAPPLNPMEGLAPSRPWLRDWWVSHAPVMLGGAPEETGRKIGEDIGKGLVAVPLPPPRPDAFKPITDKAAEAGAEAGQKAGQAIADGVKDRAPEVEEQGKSLFQRLKETFSQGIFVPINFSMGDGAGGASGIQKASFGGGGGGGEGGLGSLIHRASLGGDGGFTHGGRGGGSGIDGGHGFGGGPIPGVSAKDLGDADPAFVDHIRRAAIARGIDPNAALRIANAEGLRESSANRLTPGDFVGGRATSFGPFQLHYGGAGSLGTEYTRATGHHAGDPRYWQEQIDFALDHAKKHGWAAWFGRRGARLGIWDGIRGALPGGDFGGLGAGLRVKGGLGGQAFGGGSTSPALIGLAEQLQKGGGVERFTAFNDRYHAGSGSMHARGLAADVTGDPARIIPNARALMEAQGLVEGRDYRILNEYANPSRRATGGHVHIEFRDRGAADAYGRSLPQGPLVKDAPAENRARGAGAPEIPASPAGLTIPDPPAGGFGGGGRGSLERAAERMHAAVDRFEGAGFHGQVSVSLSGTGARQARVTGLKVRGRGGVTADMGVTMPGAKESDDDWS